MIREPLKILLNYFNMYVIMYVYDHFNYSHEGETKFF